MRWIWSYGTNLHHFTDFNGAIQNCGLKSFYPGGGKVQIKNGNARENWKLQFNRILKEDKNALTKYTISKRNWPISQQVGKLIRKNTESTRSGIVFWTFFSLIKFNCGIWLAIGANHIRAKVQVIIGKNLR